MLHRLYIYMHIPYRADFRVKVYSKGQINSINFQLTYMIITQVNYFQISPIIFNQMLYSNLANKIAFSLIFCIPNYRLHRFSQRPLAKWMTPQFSILLQAFSGLNYILKVLQCCPGTSWRGIYILLGRYYCSLALIDINEVAKTSNSSNLVSPSFVSPSRLKSYNSRIFFQPLQLLIPQTLKSPTHHLRAFCYLDQQICTAVDQF